MAANFNALELVAVETTSILNKSSHLLSDLVTYAKFDPSMLHSTQYLEREAVLLCSIYELLAEVPGVARDKK
jgi:hypothetical protein